ncbi:MAG: substrate-binding domain-containing protein [Christensenella sp.]|uniref:substrate-binding domain-containing protein n=1 Tax=Christensenella sp. TaxID=1935934 RepID=UPI002B1F8F2A|nr:substrate-binding domain-containing protein [Christensenella sp.]MEA5003470.1 substrate-binding domain-containing protein [Christensenella sp.]
MRKTHRISLEEISKKINISRTTLYKVINKKGYVKDSTKELVEEALKKYNYVPNLNARDLARHTRHAVGYVGMDYSASYFFTMMQWGLKRAIDEFGDNGLDIVISKSSHRDPQKQVEEIDRMLQEGIRDFIISVSDADVLRDKIEELRTMGCNIVYLSRYAEDENRVFVGVDYYQSGVLAAEMMGKMLPDGGKVQVMVSNTLARDGYVKMRYDGFIDEIKKYKKIEVLPMKQEINTEAEASEYTKQILDEHKDLKGIFDITYKTDTVADALIKSGKQDEIRLVGFDLYEKIAPYIRNSAVDVMISQDLPGQAYLAAKLLFNYVCYNRPFEKNDYYSRLDVIVASNLEYFEY